MEILKANYYIGGTNAIHHHGLTTQIPQTFTVYNTKLSALKQIKNLNISFIKVSKKRIGGIESFKIPNTKLNANIASLARTIMDSINDWTRYNSLPIAYEWIKNRCHDQALVKELILITSKYSNKSTVRRIGYILDNCGISSTTDELLTLFSKTDEFLSCIEHTAAKTGFRSELIEKDFLCSAILLHLYQNLCRKNARGINSRTTCHT